MWGEQASYRVQLKDFQVLDPPLTREALFFDDERTCQGLLAILNFPEGHGLFFQ